MPTPEEKEYILFVNWLQNTHPKLYDCCWQHITPALPGEQLMVSKGQMDNETHEAVIKATQDFYRIKISSK